MTIDSNIHTADPSIVDQNSPGIVLPKWFLITIATIATVFSATYLPWSVWVTWTMIDYLNIRDNRGDILADHKMRLQVLETSRENHALQLQAISSTRFTAEQANALNQGTLSEIRAVAAEVKSLQRDFDRNFGKLKPAGTSVEVENQ